MTKPVLCLFTSKTCGHCKNLKPKWGAIKSNLSSLCTVYEYEIDKLPDKFSPKIRSLIGWFPCIIMFDASDFASSKNNHSLVPRHAILNGKYDTTKGKAEYVPSGKQINADDLSSWVKEMTNTPEFKTGKSSNINVDPQPAKTAPPQRPTPAPKSSAPVLDDTCASTWKLRSKPYY